MWVNKNIEGKNHLRQESNPATQVVANQAKILKTSLDMCL